MRLINVLLCSAFVFVSCSNNRDEDFKVPENYRNWKKPVSEILDYPISGHTMKYRIIYANDLSYTAKFVKDKSGNKKVDMPDGSLIIKENYMIKKNIGKKEPVLTIMLKNRNNKMSKNEWLYYMKKPGKQVILVQNKMCIGCHEAANEKHPYFDGNKKGIYRDYLFVPFEK